MKILHEKKKKKVCSSVTYTTGDPKINCDHFNKMLSGKVANNSTGILNGTFKNLEAEKACETVGTFASQSPDGASSISLGNATVSAGEGGMSEALDLEEQKIYVTKKDAIVEIPDHIKILPRKEIEDAIAQVEPEEEFEVGYVTPIYFYSDLDDKFDLVKCTQLTGYTGIDYIEARANDEENKEARTSIAKNNAELHSQNQHYGVDLSGRPNAQKPGDFSADYSQTNKTVNQHKDRKDQSGRNYETILFYPKVGSKPTVIYYLDLHNGHGFIKVRRDQLEKYILDHVQEIANQLSASRRWDAVKLAAKIQKQLDSDAATISAKELNSENRLETRSKISGQGIIEKPQVRALYTNQIYFIQTKAVTLGSWLTENIDNKAKENTSLIEHIQDRPEPIESDQVLYGADNTVVDCQTDQKVITHSEDEKPLDCLMKKPPLEKPLTEAGGKKGRKVTRYFIRPQHIWCAKKSDILNALIDQADENCTVYTLVNLDDNKDITKLTNKDIIYYYDDGILYDKNHVRVMDYDLAVKHEEDRAKLDIEHASDAQIEKVYYDRITGGMSESLSDNPLDLSFDDITEDLDDVCCICGEPITGYGNNPYPVKEEGRCCDACNIKFVIPARMTQVLKNKLGGIK